MTYKGKFDELNKEANDKWSAYMSKIDKVGSQHSFDDISKDELGGEAYTNLQTAVNSLHFFLEFAGGHQKMPEEEYVE